MKREDDYLLRRVHLKDLTEAQLEARFWEVCGQIVDPLLDLARDNTTPSIERSILMRMGFSSQEAAKIVTQTIDRGMIGKGCGHLVYRLAQIKGLEIRPAGLALAEGEGFDELKVSFKGEQSWT